MSEAYRSAQFKRGTIILNDPARARSRVRIEDEDGTQSYWLAWNMPAAGASKIFNAPDVGSQVNVLLDRHGEDGVILGARYSSKDTPPTTDGNLLKAFMQGGADIDYHKGTGKLTMRLPGGLAIEGNVDFSNGYVKSEGRRIDHTHTHPGIVRGGASTDPPNV